MDTDLKILEALQDKKTEVPVDEQLQITRGAYAKVMTLAKLISRIAGSGMEAYGYLVKPRDSLDDIVTDVYLGNDQDTEGSYCRISEEGVLQACRDFESSGYSLLGWWHSHGSHGTFHSGTDWNNFRKILHGISSQTLYKTEEAVHIMEGDTLRVDNYKITGVELKGDIRILKKIERDPFAYSLVVNERGENYRRCWTKTYDPVSKKFDMNEPKEPELKIVEGDVALDIPELEWEVYEKIQMDRDTIERRKGPFNQKQYRNVARKFVESLDKYESEGGRYAGFMQGIQDSQEPLGRLVRMAEPGTGSLEKDGLEDRLTEELSRSELSRLQRNGITRARFEHENRLALQLMVGFSKVDDVEKQDAVIEKAKEKSGWLYRSAEIAEEGAKSLTRYAMEHLTDYKNEKGHKYVSLISNILVEMSRGKSFEEASARESYYQGAQKQDLLLFKQRDPVFNQHTHDLYCKKEEGVLHEFLREFSKAYQKGGSCDELIENYVMPYAEQEAKKVLEKEERIKDTIRDEIRKEYTGDAPPVETSRRGIFSLFPGIGKIFGRNYGSRKYCQ